MERLREPALQANGVDRAAASCQARAFAATRSMCNACKSHSHCWHTQILRMRFGTEKYSNMNFRV